MNDITTVLPRLVNKTIAHFVMKEGVQPRAQLFIVFTDGTYYEFYSNSPIDGAGSTDSGGLPHALAYSSPHQKVVF